ncbi:MAG: hypothetical protein QOG19_2293, partial [Mycobacterium sp.]|nr:hypothetical protein [Mycobacterium sp.]
MVQCHTRWRRVLLSQAQPIDQHEECSREVVFSGVGSNAVPVELFSDRSRRGYQPGEIAIVL